MQKINKIKHIMGNDIIKRISVDPHDCVLESLIEISDNLII